MEAITTLADLEALIPKTSWLWPDRLVRGHVNALVGASGSGKSAEALDNAGTVLQGECWADGSPCLADENVILVDTESSQALWLERAKKWGLPLDRILLPMADPLADFRLDHADHFQRLADLADLERPGLIIIDSLRGAHRTNENSSELHELMCRLANLARDTDSAVLVVHHLRKANQFEQQQGGVTLDRIRGSSAIVQMARTVLAIDQPDQASDWMRLQVIKNNLAPLAEPLGFRITADGLIWGEAPSTPHVETATDRATDYLKDALKKQPRWAAEIYSEADQIGISTDALKRAKGQLRIPSIKKNGRWEWGLPASVSLT